MGTKKWSDEREPNRPEKPTRWPHLDEPILTDEGEKIKLALTHLKNIKQFARYVQDTAIHDRTPILVSGMTELILRIDTAIDEITGEAFNDESQGVLL